MRTHVVWVPMTRANRSDVPKASVLVTEATAKQYWDEEGFLMRGYRSVLGLPEDAWDVYFVYGPEARWDDKNPPKPAYWMHQLGEADKPRVEGPFLDAERFASEVIRHARTSTAAKMETQR